MGEIETCICGAEVPAGDTGLCPACEEMELPDELVEAESPEEASFSRREKKAVDGA